MSSWVHGHLAGVLIIGLFDLVGWLTGWVREWSVYKFDFIFVLSGGFGGLVWLLSCLFGLLLGGGN